MSSLLKTGHEVVFSSGKSYIRHLKTDAWQPMVEKNGVFEVNYDLSPYAVGLKPPPLVMNDNLNTAGCVEAVGGTALPRSSHPVIRGRRSGMRPP